MKKPAAVYGFVWRGLRNLISGALLLIVLLGPLGGLVWQAGVYLRSVSADTLPVLLPGTRTVGLLLQSLGFAGCTALCGTVLGFLSASALWKLPGRRQRFWRWFFLALASLPPALHALAWMTAAGWLNRLLAPAGLAPIFLRGWGWLIWVQTMAFLPLTTGLSLIGFERLPAQQWETACLYGTPWKAFWKAAFPQAKPYLLASGGILFLLSLTDFNLPSLFQVNVYALEIFTEFNVSAEAGSAFLYALPLCLITVPAGLLTSSRIRCILSTSAPRQQARPDFVWPFGWEALQNLALFMLGLQVCVPALTLLLTAGSFNECIASVVPAGQELLTSFQISLLTAVFSLPFMLWGAGFMRRSSACARAGWVILSLLLAMPAPLTGIGLIAVWNHPGWPVYGTLMMPVLALLARWLPYAVIVALVQVQRIEKGLMEAERVFHSGWLKSWLLVYLPLLAPGLLAAFFLVMALSLGELGATLLVLPPGKGTLAVRLYNYLHYGAAQTVSALSLLTAVIGVLSGLGVIYSFERLSPNRRSR